MRNRYVQLLRRSVWPLVRLSFTVAVFWSMYASLMNWIPRGVAAAELDDSVQLLAQLLGLLVGVLLVGTTVSLSSFDLSEPIAQISSSIASSTQSFHSEFFSSGRSRHRILRRHARRRMLARPGVRQLAFPSKDYRGEPWVIERPEWDGAWYQIASSPFASTGHSRTERRQVQALHEAVICAQLVINSVIRFRGSAATLLGPTSGSNGTRWFLEDLDRHIHAGQKDLNGVVDLDVAASLVGLALHSEHYMREEFAAHISNVQWHPLTLTAFQLAYLDYSTSLIYLVGKLQLLRWANAVRDLNAHESSEQRWPEALGLTRLDDSRNSIRTLRTQVVSAHGMAMYFGQVKRWSVPGIGVSMLVLAGLLTAWPWLKWAADAEGRTQGFAILYSATVAALWESAWFLWMLLWKRRGTT